MRFKTYKFLFVCFFVKALFNFNYNAGVGLYAGLSLLSTVAALLLPIETKGKPLKVCYHSSFFCIMTSPFTPQDH